VSAADYASAFFKKLDPEAQLPGGHDQQQAVAVHRLSQNSIHTKLTTPYNLPSNS
jgi:hypothetical protein